VRTFKVSQHPSGGRERTRHHLQEKVVFFSGLYFFLRKRRKHLLEKMGRRRREGLRQGKEQGPPLRKGKLNLSLKRGKFQPSRGGIGGRPGALLGSEKTPAGKNKGFLTCRELNFPEVVL